MAVAYYFYQISLPVSTFPYSAYPCLALSVRRHPVNPVSRRLNVLAIDNAPQGSTITDSDGRMKAIVYTSVLPLGYFL